MYSCCIVVFTLAKHQLDPVPKLCDALTGSLCGPWWWCHPTSRDKDWEGAWTHTRQKSWPYTVDTKVECDIVEFRRGKPVDDIFAALRSEEDSANVGPPSSAISPAVPWRHVSWCLEIGVLSSCGRIRLSLKSCWTSCSVALQQLVTLLLPKLGPVADFLRHRRWWRGISEEGVCKRLVWHKATRSKWHRLPLLTIHHDTSWHIMTIHLHPYLNRLRKQVDI